jgi:hypothetical protein
LQVEKLELMKNVCALFSNVNALAVLMEVKVAQVPMSSIVNVKA